MAPLPPPIRLTERVATSLHGQQLLPAGPVIIAFSGGPDSLCLLHLLADLATAFGWQLIAAHLDHGLRPTSAAEVGLVRQLAAARAIRCVTDRVEVADLAQQRGWSIEAAARVARYRFLAAVAAEYAQAPVVTGHTRDDQAETLLLRLARGTGLTGLTAMRLSTYLPPAVWQGPATARPLMVVRPLLTIGRSAIQAELAQRALAPLQDASNSDPAYARNRLRHQLLVHWEQLEPGIATRLARTADLLTADEEYLNARLAERWEGLVTGSAQAGHLSCDRRLFLAEPLALQRRLLRRAVAELGGAIPSARAIEASVRLITQSGGGTVELSSMVFLSVGPERLVCRRPAVSSPLLAPQLAPGEVLPFEPGAMTTFGNGQWSLTSRMLAPLACHEPRDGYHAHFQLSLVADHPYLRTLRPGDRIRIPGLGGRKKLSDLFIDRKVPRQARAGIPLLVGAAGIAWVVGQAVGEPYCATDEAAVILCCRVSPTQSGATSSEEESIDE